MTELPTRDLDAHTSIHHQISGRRVHYVATNGNILLIKMEDGRELQVAWVDDNGNPIKGKPAIRACGLNVQVGVAKMFGKS